MATRALIAALVLAALLAPLYVVLHVAAPGAIRAAPSGAEGVEVVAPPPVLEGPVPIIVAVRGGSVTSAHAVIEMNATMYQYRGVVLSAILSDSRVLSVDAHPMRVGGLWLVVLPPPPVQILRWEDATGATGVINVTALVKLNVSVEAGGSERNYTLVFEYKPQYRLVEGRLYPVWSPSRPVPLLNSSLYSTAPAGSGARICGVVVGGIHPRFNVSIAVGGLSSWSLYAARAGSPPAWASSIASSLNSTLDELIETLLRYTTSAQLVDKPNYTGPAVAGGCVEVDTGALGLGPGSLLALRLEAGSVYTQPVVYYLYNPSARIRVLVVDPTLPYLLSILTPNATLYSSLPWSMLNTSRIMMEVWGNWRRFVENLTGLPLPHWEYIGAVARLEVRAWVDAPPRGYDVVVYASPLVPPPPVAQRLPALEEALAEGVLRRLYSLVVLGPVAPRYYAEVSPMGFTVRVYSPHSPSLPLILGLVNDVLLLGAARLYNCSAAYTLYTPPLLAAPATLVATRYAGLLGLEPGTSYTVRTPVGRVAYSLGYRAYSAPDWLLEAGYRGSALTGATSDAELAAAEEVLSFYRGVLGAPTPSNALLEMLPGVASGVYGAAWTGTSLRLVLPGCGVVEAPVTSALLSALRDPLPLPLLVGPLGSAVVYRPLCSLGVSAVYSTLPLQYSSDAPGILAALTRLAAEKPACSAVPGGYLVYGRVELPSGNWSIASATLLLLEAGGSGSVVLEGGGAPRRLVVAPLDYGAGLRVYINGSLAEPSARLGSTLVYDLGSARAWNVTVVAVGGTPQPVRVLLLLEVRPGAVTVTTTTTVTETTTTTVFRNVTVPAGTITRTVTVVSTTTVVRRETSTVTRTVYETRVLERNLTVTVTRAYTSTVTVTRVVERNATVTVTSTYTAPPTTVTRVKTVVVHHTVVKPRVVTVTVERVPRERLLVLLAAGVAGGVAVGFLASRLLARRGGG